MLNNISKNCSLICFTKISIKEEILLVFDIVSLLIIFLFMNFLIISALNKRYLLKYISLIFNFIVEEQQKLEIVQNNQLVPIDSDFGNSWNHKSNYGDQTSRENSCLSSVYNLKQYKPVIQNITIPKKDMELILNTLKSHEKCIKTLKSMVESLQVNWKYDSICSRHSSI